MTLQNVEKNEWTILSFSTLGGRNAEDLSKTGVKMFSQLWKGFPKTEPMRQHNL